MANNFTKVFIKRLHFYSRLNSSKYPTRDHCGFYREEGMLGRISMPRVWSCDSLEGVTLMAQVSCDLNRLIMFEQVLKGWPGPVSLTLYVQQGKENLLEDLVKVPLLLSKANLELHLAADNAVSNIYYYILISTL